MTDMNTSRPTLRFLPYYRESAYRYQKFLVKVEFLAEGEWQSCYPYASDRVDLRPEMRQFYPIHCAIVDSLVRSDWPVHREPFSHNWFHLAKATALIQKWRRAESLYSIQGLAIENPEEWARHKLMSFDRGNIAQVLREHTSQATPVPRLAPPRKTKGVIYLIHADPFDAETLVGYVGQSVSPDDREESHMSGRDRSTALLVATIKANGKKPVFTVLQSCAAKQLNYYEKKWYGTLIAAGWKLFNEVELASR